jgi:hypothetical protein
VKPDFRHAGRFWLLVLDAFGAAAIYMPWGVVYYEAPLTDDVVEHETVHHQQRLRDGAVLFTVKYLWWTLRYGYRKNPYEVEAYKE